MHLDYTANSNRWLRRRRLRLVERRLRRALRRKRSDLPAGWPGAAGPVPLGSRWF